MKTFEVFEMKLTKNKKRLSQTSGIVHFWDLPSSLYLTLKQKFKDSLMEKFMTIAKTKYRANKLTGIARPTISEYINRNNHKMKISLLLRIVKIINFDLREIERNISWIGDRSSQGIKNPKLPFDFNSRQGARFVAAICNDGWISDGVYYSNSDASLRNSVKNDVAVIFGGDENTVHEWLKDKDQYLSFPSVIRDVLVLLTEFKGVKSENNPAVPFFVFKDETFMYGWLEQTIADEGNIDYHPQRYRREIKWTRSFKEDLTTYKLHEDEIKMLSQLGINHKVYTVGKYKTVTGVRKVRSVIRIAKRENLIKLRRHIIIPSKVKEDAFTAMMNNFGRYKYLLRIKEKVLELCRERKVITSSLLKNEMKYARVGVAKKWLHALEKEGLLRCVKNANYSHRAGRSPAEYVLTEQMI